MSFGFTGMKNKNGFFLKYFQTALNKNFNSLKGMLLERKAKVRESKKLTMKFMKPITGIPKIPQKSMLDEMLKSAP